MGQIKFFVTISHFRCPLWPGLGWRLKSWPRRSRITSNEYNFDFNFFWQKCWCNHFATNHTSSERKVKHITCFHDSWIYDFFSTKFSLFFYKVEVFYCLGYIWDLHVLGLKTNIVCWKHNQIQYSKCPKIYQPNLSAQAQKFGILLKKGFIGRP
jgi:hypothetical protein